MSAILLPTPPERMSPWVSCPAILYLVIDEENLEEAVRDLVRVGLNNIKGCATPAELELYLQESDSAASVETIYFKDTVERYRQPGFGMLDVYKAIEFKKGHIPGATNIAHTRLLDRKGDLEQDKTWLVHCRSGARAAVAAALLDRDGLTCNTSTITSIAGPKKKRLSWDRRTDDS